MRTSKSLSAALHQVVDHDEQLAGRFPQLAIGVYSAVTTGQPYRLRGPVAAAHGDDPELVETELRIGIASLEAFGARGYCAQAQEELARWLLAQDRPAEAAPLIEAARATYAEVGAHG